MGAFKNQANSHLDDMTKDLDDMVTTIDEGGFWRLLSNSIELSFNLGQLQGLDIPASVEPTSSPASVGLETSIDAMTDPVANEDSAALLGVIDTMRAQITESTTSSTPPRDPSSTRRTARLVAVRQRHLHLD